jgi:hypothetical protein
MWKCTFRFEAAASALNEGDSAALGTAHGPEIGGAANEGTQNRYVQFCLPFLIFILLTGIARLRFLSTRRRIRQPGGSA